METIQVSVATCPLYLGRSLRLARFQPPERVVLNFPTALNPDPKNLPKLDPKDQLLLGDSTGSSLFVNSSTAGSSTPHAVPTVTWLRKTEYITSKEGGTRSSSSQDQCVSLIVVCEMDDRSFSYRAKNLADASVDVSRSAQLRDIDASFEACNTHFDPGSLKHPNKPDVTAVGSYEIFPNVDIWANTYDLFKFSERPGERPLEVRVSNFNLERS